MQLKSLRIAKVEYGTDKGQFKGVIEFSNNLGSVELTLSSDQCNGLFKVCADGIVDTAKAAAENLSVLIAEHKNTLEAMTNEN